MITTLSIPKAIPYKHFKPYSTLYQTTKAPTIFNKYETSSFNSHVDKQNNGKVNGDGNNQLKSKTVPKFKLNLKSILEEHEVFICLKTRMK